MNTGGKNLMTKAELIQFVSTKTNLKKNESEKIINSFVEVVNEQLVNGDDVAIKSNIMSGINSEEKK